MAKLIIKAEGEFPERTLELKSGVTRLGRSSINDFMLPFPEISEKHCEILVDNDFVFVRDLDSSNGTYIDGDLVKESALYAGQALRIGMVQMILDGPVVTVALPELPKPEQNSKPVALIMTDGFAACLSHERRHAIWECPHCQRVYCDECIRKLRRIGGVHLKLCPACSSPCQLSPWSEMMRKKKKGFFNSLVSKIGKIADTVKRSTNLLKPMPPRE